MSTDRLERRIVAAIEATDTDELLRAVDRLCSARDWDRLDLLREHCRAAVERGKQVWAVDLHIRYRVALEGPPERVGRVLSEDNPRFGLGPLPEVAACRHTWPDLEPFLVRGPERAFVAHERVVRGETVSPDAIDPMVLELPTCLLGWEPAYPLAAYESDRAEFPTPDQPEMEPIDLPSEGSDAGDVAGVEGLLALTATWVNESTGRAEAVSVEGSAPAALAALGVPRAWVAPIRSDQAMAWMAWAAASGGAYGRRRGAAAGRFGAWWAATAVAGLEWPPDPGELGAAIAELSWFLWSDGMATGWLLRLAVEDPTEGLAWATAAVDFPPEEI